MKSAWLVTWKWIGDHAAIEDEVVALVGYRRKGPFVKGLIEQLYIAKTSSASEKLRYVRDSKSNPYPASFTQINGVAWEGSITCGHNPYLFGRLVSNVRIELKDGEEKLQWDERPVPALVPL